MRPSPLFTRSPRKNGCQPSPRFLFWAGTFIIASILTVLFIIFSSGPFPSEQEELVASVTERMSMRRLDWVPPEVLSTSRLLKIARQPLVNALYHIRFIVIVDLQKQRDTATSLLGLMDSLHDQNYTAYATNIDLDVRIVVSDPRLTTTKLHETVQALASFGWDQGRVTVHTVDREPTTPSELWMPISDWELAVLFAPAASQHMRLPSQWMHWVNGLISQYASVPEEGFFALEHDDNTQVVKKGPSTWYEPFESRIKCPLVPSVMGFDLSQSSDAAHLPSGERALVSKRARAGDGPMVVFGKTWRQFSAAYYTTTGPPPGSSSSSSWMDALHTYMANEHLYFLKVRQSADTDVSMVEKLPPFEDIHIAA